MPEYVILHPNGKVEHLKGSPEANKLPLGVVLVQTNGTSRDCFVVGRALSKVGKKRHQTFRHSDRKTLPKPMKMRLLLLGVRI